MAGAAIGAAARKAGGREHISKMHQGIISTGRNVVVATLLNRGMEDAAKRAALNGGMSEEQFGSILERRKQIASGVSPISSGKLGS